MGVFNYTQSINEWNANNTYSIGTYVKYNGNMYKAIKNVPKGINIGFSEYWDEDTVEKQLTADVNEEKVPFQFAYDETTNSYGANIKGNFISFGGNFHRYSTDEQIIGEWIDGKPLYEKVTTFGAIAAGTSNSRVASGASNIDTMVEYKVYVTEYGNKVSLPYPLFASTDNYSQYSINCQGYDPVNNNFRIDTGREIPVTDGYIIFRYTKTTD